MLDARKESADTWCATEMTIMISGKLKPSHYPLPVCSTRSGQKPGLSQKLYVTLMTTNTSL